MIARRRVLQAVAMGPLMGQEALAELLVDNLFGPVVLDPVECKVEPLVLVHPKWLAEEVAREFGSLSCLVAVGVDGPLGCE